MKAIQHLMNRWRFRIAYRLCALAKSIAGKLLTSEQQLRLLHSGPSQASEPELNLPKLSDLAEAKRYIETKPVSDLEFHAGILQRHAWYFEKVSAILERQSEMMAQFCQKLLDLEDMAKGAQSVPDLTLIRLEDFQIDVSRQLASFGQSLRALNATVTEHSQTLDVITKPAQR